MCDSGSEGGVLCIWTAVRLNGQSIISVIAGSSEEARREIRAELSRPGRSSWLAAWQRSGELVVERK